MDANQLQFWEVAGDAVEQDGATDAAHGCFFRVHHRLADLHLNGYAEFDALGVERVVLCMIGRQIEPVRIDVRTDEAHVFHGILERAYTVHALIRIDARHGIEATRVFLDGARDHLIGEVERTRQPLSTHFGSEQERLLDARFGHLRELLFERDALHIGFRFHFPGEELVLPTRSERQGFFGPDSADDIDGRYGRGGGHFGKSPIRRCAGFGLRYCLNRGTAAAVRRSTGRFAVPSLHNVVATPQQTLVQDNEYSLRLAGGEL